MSRDYTYFSAPAPRLIRFLRGKRAPLLEPILLFAVFFLPGYLFQAQTIDPGIFDLPLFHLLYQIQTLPLILLLLYILSGKGTHWWVPYRITRFSARDILKGCVVWAGIWATLLPISLLVGLLFPHIANEATGIPWRLNRPELLPLVAITSLSTGYWEELFFRAYLDGQLRWIGIGPRRAAAAGILLFAAGHLYQGIIAAAGTAIIGAVLLYAFRRTRSVHTVAIGHGLYNFSVLAATLIVDFG